MISDTPTSRTADDGPGLIPVTTFVLWTTCLAVGIAGALLGYPMPPPPIVEAPAVETRVINVETPAPPQAVTEIHPAAGQSSSAPPLAAPPALPPIASAPPLAAVTPITAFPLPTAGPALANAAEITRLSQSHADAFAGNQTSAIIEPSAAPAVPPPTGVRHLTLGEGEGKQPAPDYPRSAVEAGQEGIVGIRFSVDDQGRVTQARVASPCRWPVLNQAALRTVRGSWRLAPGPPREYEVSIQFQLQP